VARGVPVVTMCVPVVKTVEFPLSQSIALGCGVMGIQYVHWTVYKFSGQRAKYLFWPLMRVPDKNTNNTDHELYVPGSHNWNDERRMD
jgi:hypothetical protein